jgi:hypothetical protein
MEQYQQVDGSSGELLNRAQQTSVEITLRMFEETLQQTLDWLGGEEVQGILFTKKFDLAPNRQELLRELIAEALAHIEQLKQDLDLKSQPVDLAQTLRGQLVVGWESLEDAKAARLRRYGDVDNRLSAVLDARLDRLARISMILASVLDHPARH